MEWQAYYQLDPFGDERADLQTAILATVVARIAGNKKAKPADFMPDFKPQKKQQTPTQMMNVFAQFAKAHNAAIARRGNG